MDLSQIITWAVLGALAGWLSNNIFFKGNHSLIATITLGILGSFVGGYIAKFLKIQGAIVGGLSIASIITATLGAFVLTWLIKLVSR